MTKNFIIYECNIEKVTKKLETLKRKAKKFNLPLAYSIIENGIKKVDTERYGEAVYEYLMTYFVVVNYKPMKIGNYKPIALLEAIEGSSSNLVYTFGDIEDLGIDINSYKNATLTCDHCKTNHTRKYAVLIQNLEDGSVKQVGKGCLKDYTGHDVNALIRFYEYLEGFTIEASVTGYNTYYYNTIDILKCTLEVMRANNMEYVKTSDNYREATKTKVLEKLGKYQPTTDFDYSLITEAIEWINNSNTDTSSEYLSNLKALANTEYIEHKHLGLLVSFIQAHNNHLKWEREKSIKEEINKKTEQESQWQGELKDRLKDLELTLTFYSGFETMYGYSYIYIFVDDKGNTFKWSTNKWLDNEKDELQGLKVFLTGTVKEHCEYKGVKQTTLTRCKYTVAL